MHVVVRAKLIRWRCASTDFVAFAVARVFQLGGSFQTLRALYYFYIYILHNEMLLRVLDFFILHFSIRTNEGRGGHCNQL